MRDFSETLQRSLVAADYLIRAASTGDPAVRQRLTSMAQDLLGEADNAVASEFAEANDDALPTGRRRGRM
jgi:hypothetical protein